MATVLQGVYEAPGDVVHAVHPARADVLMRLARPTGYPADGDRGVVKAACNFHGEGGSVVCDALMRRCLSDEFELQHEYVIQCQHTFIERA